MAIYSGTVADETVLGSGTGSNTIIGGGGHDLIDYSALSSDYSLTVAYSALGKATVTKANAGNVVGVDSITGIAAIIGSAGDDSFRLAPNFYGSTIGTQFLSIQGGAGNDTIDGHGFRLVEADYSGAATGVHVDLPAGTAADGQGGTDTLIGVIRVRGSGYGDTLTGGAGNDVFVGSGGNDTIRGGGGSNTVDYSTALIGPLTITINPDASATVIKASGTDTVTAVGSFQGSAGGDSITGSATIQSMLRLQGMAGDDTIDGAGNANNVLAYSASPTGVRIDLSTNIAADGWGGTDTLRNIRSVSGSGSDDTIIGGAAPTTFGSSLGSDSYAAGSGFDTLSYSGYFGGPVTVTFDAAGIGTARKGAGGTDTFSGIERIIGTGASDDIGGHVVSVPGSIVYLDGRYAGSGSDTLRGFGLAENIADYSNRDGELVVVLGGTDGSATIDTQVDTLVGIVAIRGTYRNDSITGSAADELFVGSVGNDTYAGGGGSDTLNYRLAGIFQPLLLAWTGAEAGTVTKVSGGLSFFGLDSFTGVSNFVGGTGNDTFSGAVAQGLSVSGGGGSDTLTYAAAAGPVTVTLASAGRSGAVLKPFSADSFTDMAVIIGSAGDDVMSGGSGVSTEPTDVIELRGGLGNDSIDGHGSNRNAVSYADSTSPVAISLAISTDGNGHWYGTALGALGSADSLTDVVRVIGSAFADGITGSAHADTLQGGQGNDSIDGGLGTDTAVIAGSRAAVTLVHNIDGSWTATGPDGTDTLTNVEFVQFDDRLVNLVQPVERDLFGDGSSDLLLIDRTVLGGTFQNVAQWQLSGPTVDSGSTISTIDNAWRIVGTGDFNGDGKADIVWQNTDGRFSIWQMNGDLVTTGATVWTPPGGLELDIAGIGDFNGDGIAEVLVNAPSTVDGQLHANVAVWGLSGTTLVAETPVYGAAAGWSVAGIGDFDGDTRSDILWRSVNGDLSIWRMDGNGFVDAQTVTNVTTDWKVAGVGDFNDDGRSDILWRNDNGTVSIWLMNDKDVIDGASIFNPGTQWDVAAVGDYNGDHNADILLRHNIDGTSDSELNMWLMNGLTVLSAVPVGHLGTQWDIV